VSSKYLARRLTRGRLLVLAAAGVLLAGCSSVDLSPGQAAVVNDDLTISQNDVDDTVLAACNYIEISSKDNPDAQPLAITDLRSSLTTTMVLAPLMEDLTEQLDLTISPADIDKLIGQQTFPDGLSDEDQEILEDYFHQSAVLQLSQALIGSNANDPSITDSSQLTADESEAGQDVVNDYLKDQDVQINPQYGSWNGGNVEFASGSLSTAVSDAAQPPPFNPDTGAKDVSDLPPSQVCGG